MPSGSPLPQGPKFEKGQPILYVNRDGTLADAKVVSVDRSIYPVQYAIVLNGAENERWTEEDRLRPCK
ncbi:hypothetical protein DUNSADRAFT_1599 [Dunaliella salina]|uniref:Encoded protein n=1 Tax=Dunaliella salina TaxID=3046 RepID=A0ABQ7H8I8_DUNSA|nr:hypothetical protein DUNSADRAFT_1599 [Dunaliella salina]|eukprot:KAF5843172.1 hypothetical protein DUNSADRAFT_1599 [Dunaliella salina]